MFNKVALIENRYEEINIKLTDPEIISDQEQYTKLMKEHSELTEIVEKFREYKSYKKTIEDSEEMLEEKPDKELREMIMAEIEQAQAGIEKTTHELKLLMMPKDPNDERNVIIEIRGGAGGDEAALFSGVLLECIQCMLRAEIGHMILLMQMKQSLVALKKLSFR